MGAFLILVLVAVGLLPTVGMVVFWILYRRERRTRLRIEDQARAREATFAQALGETHMQTLRVARLEREIVALRPLIRMLSQKTGHE